MSDPERYEANKILATRDADHFVPKMVAKMSWKGNEKILDYGCGTGSTGAKTILPSVESNDSKLFSVDISKEMVEYAMKNFINPRVTYAVGNVLNKDFPFDGIQFDKIFSLYVLHHVRDYSNALMRFHALLKPQGYLGFTVYVSQILGIIRKLGEDPKWSKYLKGYESFTPEWVDETSQVGDLFKRTLEHVGFEIVSLEFQKRSFVYSSFDVMSDVMLSLNPFVKKIPDLLLPEFIEDHRNFLTQNPDVEIKSTAAQVNYRVLCVVAQKL